MPPADQPAAPSAVGWISSVTVDCRDPEALAAFWGALLGLWAGERDGPYVELEDPPLGAPSLCFQQVPEARTTKVRLHLDVQVSDLDAATRRAVDLGATHVADHLGDEFDERWRVMADPEGNQFCLIAPPA